MTDLLDPAAFRAALQAWLGDNDLTPPDDPSLEGAGRRFTVPYLVESVLLPNRKISPVFRSSVIATTRGKVVTGLVVSETGQVVTVLTPEAKRVEIPKGEIETRKTQNISAMSGGLVHATPK